MTLSEIVRLHKLTPSNTYSGLWGTEIEFTNPDANTERAFCALSDFEISLNYWVEPQERKHVIRLKPKPKPAIDAGDNDTFTGR